MKEVPDAARDAYAAAEHPWVLEALASLEEGVLVVDENARVVYFNAAAVRLAGSTKLDADRSRWPAELGVFQSDEKTPFPADELPLVRALQGVSTRDVELFVRNDRVPNGVHLCVSGSPIRDTSGRVRGGTIIFRDMSERKRHEAQISEGERQTRAILDNIPDIAWLKDGEGRFVAVNTQFARAAGKAGPEDVIGLTDLDLWPRDLAEGYRADDQDVMRTGARKTVEERFVDAEGKSYWIETVKTRIVARDGEVIGTTGIARDITERHRDAEALRLANDELERRFAEAQEKLVRRERLAVLGQVAGGVAHQIRNPLAAIMNATYVLRRHLSPNQHPNVDDAIRIIHDEVRHANVIITELLDYARVRSPDRHPASIVELLERALAADWVPAGTRIERRIEEVPLLDIDADQLHGALSNIVRNAIEAMPADGVLIVEARLDGEHVLVAIEDTGPGLSTQVKEHLFEPLHSTKPLGIGLGLVTARTYVEAHGGRITCVDVPRGARFEVRLPLT